MAAGGPGSIAVRPESARTGGVTPTSSSSASWFPSLGFCPWPRQSSLTLRLYLLRCPRTGLSAGLTDDKKRSSVLLHPQHCLPHGKVAQHFLHRRIRLEFCGITRDTLAYPARARQTPGTAGEPWGCSCRRAGCRGRRVQPKGRVIGICRKPCELLVGRCAPLLLLRRRSAR